MSLLKKLVEIMNYSDLEYVFLKIRDSKQIDIETINLIKQIAYANCLRAYQ